MPMSHISSRNTSETVVITALCFIERVAVNTNVYNSKFYCKSANLNCKRRCTSKRESNGFSVSLTANKNQAAYAHFLNLKNTRRDLIILTYALLVALSAIVLFLYGFFPIKYDDNVVATMRDIPGHVEHVRVKKDTLYRPIVKKVIVMIIDALRWDFITGPIGIEAMPITNSLIRGNSSCLMQAKVNPPTVTMPRIKAMMTGAVPGFVDVALNLGHLSVSGDSLLRQAKNRGHALNFYGDDTWLKIFPDMFDRHDGTTSFFVPDFTEVDNNVTRHVAEELQKKDDWSILIFHYLGLDHIGHVAGPFSSLIKPKLREMDNIIGKIATEIISWNENGLPAMLIVCGDHGMKNSGGHGGSTAEEMLVPFLTFGATSSCPSSNDDPNRISQVDIAATLSVMMGLPIPSANIGSIPLYMLNGLSDSTKLFVLYYNSQQVFKQFKKLPSHKSSQAYDDYNDAVRLHVKWLTNQKGHDNIKAALNLYDKSLQSMKDQLMHSMIDYDLHTMTAAVILMVHIIHILINGQNYRSATTMTKVYWIIGSLFSYQMLRCLWEPELGISVFNVNRVTLITIGLGIALNSYLCANIHWPVDIAKRLMNYTLRKWIFPLGLIAHSISLASTSFVEEEHQTWYFFWTTLLILLFCDNTRERCNLQIGVKILLTLLGHRILRKLNSTGDKFAHLPDIARWLSDQDDNTAMTILLISALGLLISIGYLCDERKHRNKTLIPHTFAAICIYLRHMANNTVAKLPLYSESRGIAEVRIFWIVMLLYSIYWIYRLFRTTDRKLFAPSLLRFFIQIWVMTSAILHRPHNVVLLPMQLISGYVVDSALHSYEHGEDANTYIYIFLGNVFYFYQGNSNNLATVDVAAGYVGMESYIPIVMVTFVTVNTYSAPVLAYLTFVYRSMLRQETNSYSKTILTVNRSYAFWRFLPVAVYTVMVAIQRFHLFVWTVFSPKLLYEATYCGVMFSFMLPLQLISVLYKNKH